LQPLGNGVQDQVAGLMAESVVDELERVESIAMTATEAPVRCERANTWEALSLIRARLARPVSGS
jgi:hypothetical protein